MDRRLLIIRMALFAVLGALCLDAEWFWASAWFCLVGLMMPAFSVTCDCTNCSVCIASTQVQVVLAGITEGTCGSCASLNTTYVLPINAIAAPGKCYFTKNPAAALACNTQALTFVWGGATTPSDTTTRVRFSEAFSGFDIIWDTGAADPQDCTVNPGAIAFTSQLGGITCDASASTATVTLL